MPQGDMAEKSHRVSLGHGRRHWQEFHNAVLHTHCGKAFGPGWGALTEALETHP